MKITHDAIRHEFADARRDAKARHRDIAAQLDISEGELIAAHVGAPPEGLRAIRLQDAWPALIESLEPLGEVMALTRNESCVHEKIGVYRAASHSGRIGLVLGGEIDLRVFYFDWAHGFAVSEPAEKGLQQSLQFFDAAGDAIHKIFLKPQSDANAYEDVVARFASADQSLGLVPAAKPARAAEQADEAIDVQGFRTAWAALEDTHQFFGLLKKFGVSRTQGLRLADPALVQPVDGGCARRLLESAARDGVSIMVFVGNDGMIQIHTGPVSRVMMMGTWVNVLDPGFNLHLREDRIAHAWIVRKPTSDGLVTSLELFDGGNELIAQFFGERKPGKPELAAWRELVDRVAQETAPCTT